MGYTETIEKVPYPLIPSKPESWTYAPTFILTRNNQELDFSPLTLCFLLYAFFHIGQALVGSYLLF